MRAIIWIARFVLDTLTFASSDSQPTDFTDAVASSLSLAIGEGLAFTDSSDLSHNGLMLKDARRKGAALQISSRRAQNREYYYTRHASTETTSRSCWATVHLGSTVLFIMLQLYYTTT